MTLFPLESPSQIWATQLKGNFESASHMWAGKVSTTIDLIMRLTFSSHVPTPSSSSHSYSPLFSSSSSVVHFHHKADSMKSHKFTKHHLVLLGMPSLLCWLEHRIDSSWWPLLIMSSTGHQGITFNPQSPLMYFKFKVFTYQVIWSNLIAMLSLNLGTYMWDAWKWGLIL